MLALEANQTKEIISRLIERTRRMTAHALSLLSKKIEGNDRLQTSLTRWAEELAPEIISRVTQSVIEYGNYFLTASSRLGGIDRDALARPERSDRERKNLASVVESLAGRAARQQEVIERTLARCEEMSEPIGSVIDLKAIAADLGDLVNGWRALREKALSVAERLEDSAQGNIDIHELSDFEIQRGRRACRELIDFASNIQAASLSGRPE